MSRTLIADLKTKIGEQARIQGWVLVRRDQGKMVFGAEKAKAIASKKMEGVRQKAGRWFIIYGRDTYRRPFRHIARNFEHLPARIQAQKQK